MILHKVEKKAFKSLGVHKINWHVGLQLRNLAEVNRWCHLWNNFSGLLLRKGKTNTNIHQNTLDIYKKYPLFNFNEM